MLRHTVRALRLLVVLGVSLACGRQSPQTAAAAGSPVAIDGALGSTLVKAGSAQTLTARIRVSTERRSVAARPPVNVALLVDTSGSMEGRAIDDARAASLALLDSLGKEDHLAVVVFHSKAETLLPSTRIADADVADLRKKIGRMKAQGTTDMASGLRAALAEVRKGYAADGVNRVVMLGDGVPNDPSAIGATTSEATGSGISITTLGLGNDYDEMLMGRIAQESGGKFSFVEDSAKVKSFFEDEVVRLHRVVARGAVLELQPGPGVVVREAIGRPTTQSGSKVMVVLGDLTLGEEHEVVVELGTNGTKEGANVEALDAVLHWQGLGGEPHEERVFLGAKATADQARIDASKDQKVLDAAARAKDAAATIRMIESQRKTTTARPADLQAPSPAAAQPATAPPPRAALEVRRQHAKALERFQAQ